MSAKVLGPGLAALEVKAPHGFPVVATPPGQQPGSAPGAGPGAGAGAAGQPPAAREPTGALLTSRLRGRCRQPHWRIRGIAPWLRAQGAAPGDALLLAAEGAAPAAGAAAGPSGPAPAGGASPSPGPGLVITVSLQRAAVGVEAEAQLGGGAAGAAAAASGTEGSGRGASSGPGTTGPLAAAGAGLDGADGYQAQGVMPVDSRGSGDGGEGVGNDGGASSNEEAAVQVRHVDEARGSDSQGPHGSSWRPAIAGAAVGSQLPPPAVNAADDGGGSRELVVGAAQPLQVGFGCWQQGPSWDRPLVAAPSAQHHNHHQQQQQQQQQLLQPHQQQQPPSGGAAAPGPRLRSLPVAASLDVCGMVTCMLQLLRQLRLGEGEAHATRRDLMRLKGSDRDAYLRVAYLTLYDTVEGGNDQEIREVFADIRDEAARVAAAAQQQLRFGAAAEGGDSGPGEGGGRRRGRDEGGCVEGDCEPSARRHRGLA